MCRTLFAVLIFLTFPMSVLAAHPPATFSIGQSLLTTTPSPGNAYVAGASVVLVAPVTGDFSAAGGSITTAASVTGDDLLIGGSIYSRAPVGGSFRAAGGSITIDKPVQGDIVAFGYAVHDAGRASGSVFIVAANTDLTNGASGPVIIYGNNVFLSGNFSGNVNVSASGRVAFAAGTTIQGTFSYEAPELANIPKSVMIAGGIKYTNASYLPDVGTSRILALVSVGFFVFARILGALLLTGLLAGLFPKLAEMVVDRVYTGRLRDMLLATLLGFAVFAVTPILCIMLTLTFVGIGLALLLFIAYIFLVFLAFLYAGILLGGAFARRYMRRETILWQDGMLGMFILSLIALVPVIGLLAAFILTAFSAGTLLQIFFYFAFPHKEVSQIS